MARAAPRAGVSMWARRKGGVTVARKLILAASALLLSGELAAQTFKCTNAAGRITYSGTKCSELGLKDAGEVKDRLNVTPAYKPSARAIQSPPPAPAAK